MCRKVLQGGMRVVLHHHFLFSFFWVGCLGRITDDAKMMDCMRILAPECSRATSVAAHGVSGCCGMPFLLFLLSLFFEK